LKEEVEISELRSTPCKRKAEEKFVTLSSRRRVLPSSKKKTREAEKKNGSERERERERERKRERKRKKREIREILVWHLRNFLH